MSNSLSFFIVIPVYNEADIIPEVLLGLQVLGYTGIIVVDDGSTDNLRYALRNFSIYFLRHEKNLGQGAALQTGFEFARSLDAGIVVTFDADGQHQAIDIAKLTEQIISNTADIVLGSRFLSESTDGISRIKKIILQIARLINFIFSGIYLTDAHNGMRALNRKALGLITLRENRMAHASELLFEIRRHRLRYMELPVTIRYTAYSKQKGQSVFESVKILFDLVLHKLFK